jgi:TPR repeat protein
MHEIMKGQRAYILAESAYEKLYKNLSISDSTKKKKLYDQYLKLLRTAAYCGYTDALYDMGQQYEDISHLGIPNPMYNPKKCVYWYTKACQKGDAEACNNLASFYEKGEGCIKDLNYALELYKQSSDLGSPNGKKNYKLMLHDLSKGGRYNK